MPTPEETDWDFQRDIRQLSGAIDATSAMLNKVMAEVQKRTANIPARNAEDVRVMVSLIKTASQIQTQFTAAKTELDALLRWLTIETQTEH